MSASFDSSLSQYLSGSIPATSTIALFGAWVYPTTTGAAKTVMAMADTGSANNYLEIRQNASDQWEIASSDGTAGESAGAAGTVTANQWHFLLGRWISSSIARLEVLMADGSTATTTRGGTVAPVGVDTFSLGARASNTVSRYFDGFIAEEFLANVALFLTIGGSSDTASVGKLLYQIAFGGPFSWPPLAWVASTIATTGAGIEYRSLRKGATGDGRDFHWSDRGTKLLTNNGGVGIGPHPPLPYWNVNPRQHKTPLAMGM